MEQVKVFYDRAGNTLTVWFGDPQDEYICEETGDEIILMKDQTGRVIGFEKLKLVHLNDSKGDFNSHIDRHDHIGLGKIGEEGFRNILTSRLGTLPLIMETPVDARRDEIGNLEKVKELAVGL